VSVVNTWWNFSDSLVVRYSNQMINDFANKTTITPGYPNWWLEQTRYQYGPRVYDYEGLQKTPGLVYTNMTEYTTPGNELNYIQQTQERPSVRVFAALMNRTRDIFTPPLGKSG
jgi:hypothetical protein